MRKALLVLAITLAAALFALFDYVHWLELQPPDKHTRIRVLNHNLTVWTYSPVTAIYEGHAWTYPNDQLAAEVGNGADITLVGKYHVIVAEGQVTVNGQKIADGDSNVLVTDDGRVERHTFIREGWK